MIAIPYLREPAFANGPWLHTGSAAYANVGSELAAAIESVFTATTPFAVSGTQVVLPELVLNPPAECADVVSRVMRTIALPLAAHYDIVVLEQGYGGVFVHATDLVARLRERWRVLFLAPGDPFFGGGRHPDDITLPRLQEMAPGFSYFSFVSALRSILRTISTDLLLITHRSQASYVFDLMQRHPTVVYCDGFYDAHLLTPRGLPAAARPQDREVLRELMYVLSQSPPTFCGLPSGPSINFGLMWAGYRAVLAARENWCWGAAQKDAFAAGAPSIADSLKIKLPFINSEIFHPALVHRDRTALFTTTMHNIDKKGIDPILNAIRDVPDLHVLGVFRQPECLPRIPRPLGKRLRITGLSKADMLATYHRVWVNCRISTEESSPVSVLESMACEVPQVVSPVVAQQIPLLEDGVTGFIVTPDDRERIAACLRQLLASPALRDRMGREARERVLECGTTRRLGEFERLLALKKCEARPA
jgi:glycosyltransferase involved in cell wall biosynthesis